jgi:peptidoglycan hydrolase-like amidase
MVLTDKRITISFIVKLIGVATVFFMILVSVTSLFADTGSFYKIALNIKLPQDANQYISDPSKVLFRVKVYNVNKNELLNELSSNNDKFDIDLPEAGVYSLRIEGYVDNQLMFLGADSFVLSLLNFSVSKDITLNSLMADVFITFKNYKRLPSGYTLEFTNIDKSKSYSIDISWDISIKNMPQILSLEPGIWYVKVRSPDELNQENDTQKVITANSTMVTSESTSIVNGQKATTTNDSFLTFNNQTTVVNQKVDVGAISVLLKPGLLNPLLIELYDDRVEIRPGVAFFSKFLSVAKQNSHYLLAYKQGQFEGNSNLSVNGTLTNNVEKVLVSGITNVTAYFDNGIITGLEYPKYIPGEIRVLLSSKLTSNEALSSAVFNEVNLLLQNQYQISVCGKFMKALHQTATSSSQWKIYESNDSLYISNGKEKFGPFSLDSIIFFDAQSPSSTFKIAGRNNPYEGSVEIRYSSSSKGFIIINELPVERYLVYVVASEMPSSYALEALKAQAIAARSYAIDKIFRIRTYLSTGANLDDSTNFQAYNFSLPYANATRAVEETRNEILVYEQSIANTYYYAVSGGTAFNSKDAFVSEIPYLRSRIIAISEQPSEILQFNSEDSFLSFLKNWNSKELKDLGFLEAEHPFFRWKVDFSPSEIINKVESLSNVKHIKKDSQPQMLPEATSNNISNVESLSNGMIMNMSVSKRGEGGVVKEITIETNDSYITVNSSEIKKLLNVSGKALVLQNGVKRTDFTYLPSMFFGIELQMNSNYVEKITVYGGGYGHGVGLSQVAANSLARNYGYNYADILKYFYPGTTIVNYYDFLSQL